MKKISKFIQYFATALVFTITFVNFGTNSDFPIKEIRNMNDEKLTEFLKNMQKQEKNSLTALFDKKRIAKAVTAAAGTFILELIISALIKSPNNEIPTNQRLSILVLAPFGCYLATDYLFDKFTKPIETKKNQ